MRLIKSLTTKKKKKMVLQRLTITNVLVDEKIITPMTMTMMSLR